MHISNGENSSCLHANETSRISVYEVNAVDFTTVCFINKVTKDLIKVLTNGFTKHFQRRRARKRTATKKSYGNRHLP